MSEPGGVFIAFEGGDGAGKSTQADLLGAALEAAGHEVVRTRQPGGTPLGQALRELLLHGEEQVSPRAEALIFAADKAQHVDTLIVPALRRGAVVLTDRYVDSSVAYQGAGRGLDRADVARVQKWAVAGLRPHLTIVIDVPADEGGRRRVERGDGAADRMEQEGQDFHDAVRHDFLAMAAAAPDRYAVIDGRGSAQEVHAAVLAALEHAGIPVGRAG